MFLHFLPGAEGPDLYHRTIPSRDLFHFFDGPFFDVQQMDYQPIRWGQHFEQPIYQISRSELIRRAQIGLHGSQGLDDMALFFTQIGPAQFGPDFFDSQLIQAGIDRDSRDPVLQRHRS